MDALRSLTTPLRKHDRQTDNTMPAYVIENRATEDLKITKPLSAMSMEELLEYLPQCNPSMITHFWLPAVRAQLQKMTSLLNDVGELKIESSLGQIALQKDLKSFTDEIRLIATSYHKVLESAESLVERDTKACHERLKELENQVEEALERMGAKDEEIAEQEREIEELTHTIYDVTRVLGSFIHDNVSNWVETLNEPRTEEVLEIISDYSYDVGKAQTVRYVRVPEAMIARYARDLREANELADEYRELLRGQSAMINEHSHNLDTYTNKYEIAVRVVKERDHEVLLLTQKNETLTKRLEECEAALVQSQESIAEVESKAGRYDELRGNLESLKIAHTLELAQCEEEIARLRQMLGSAREEVFARRADVKNIISQSQAAIPNPDLPATTAKGGPASKALRFFGVDRDKERIKRGGGIPSSQSMIGFTSSHHDASTHAFDTRYSSKEVTTSKSKPFLRNVSPLGKRRQARTTPTTPVESSESRSGSITSLPAVVRPRSDSLGATKRHGILASPINTHKALPNPPNRSQPLLASAARLAEVTQDVDSSTASQIASDYLENSILGQTAARRVLSNIPEVSVYGPSDAGDGDREEDHVPEYEDGSDRSVASSDREVYRRSVCALDMLNSSALPYSETETELERMLRGVTEPEQDRNNHHYHRHSTYDGGDEHGDAAAETELGVARILHLRPGNHNLRASRARERNGDVERDERYRQSFVSDSSGYRSEGSEPMTVAQLYHQGGRHIRD
ncbi:hypothetical protein HRR78_006305 [Exophiala dermatitidis]|nr:hypothetical protein HRR75_006260 [Exophiala dermatitidis]KAJ4545583.1 hypothetical protein HRR78_006305 [Exophiala dermatitidis]